MSIIMEEFKPAVNTLEEVKKLQDLVRKLEIQNQQLRNKQNKVTRKSSVSPPKERKLSSTTNVLNISNTNKDTSDKTVTKSANNDSKKGGIKLASNECHNENIRYFDDIDIIRVSDIDMSDDDSWLYTSPKGLTPEQKNESPYKWLRKDVDDPENKELQMAKKALITKLNEFDILSPPSQGQQYQHVGNPTISHLRKPQVPYKIPSPTLEHCEYSVIDTRTFTRSKKKQALELLGSSAAFESCKELEKNDTIVKLCRRGSDISLDSGSGIHPLTDANDVQEVARMQEESLRLSSPIGTPKRQSGSSLSSRRVSASSRSSVSDMDGSEHPVFSTQISEDGTYQPPTTSTPTSMQAEVFNHSDQSSPSESPYGSNISLNNVGKGKGDGYRSSLPNLNRAHSGIRPSKNRSFGDSKQQKPLAMRSATASQRSDSNLLAGSKPRREISSPTRQRLRQPSSPVSSGSSIQSAQSNDCAPQTSRSAVMSSRLAVKSGLPKPTRASSATRSRSGIPSMVSKRCVVEDSWSEGCF